MTRSPTSVCVCLTREQLAYVRERVAYDRTIGAELPANDRSFAYMHAMADSVLKAIDEPLPAYFSEACR